MRTWLCGGPPVGNCTPALGGGWMPITEPLDEGYWKADRGLGLMPLMAMNDVSCHGISCNTATTRSGQWSVVLRVVLPVVSNLECFLGELLGVVPELAEGNELDDVALHLLAVVDQRIVVGVEHVLERKEKRPQRGG